jgi:SAM-dependent methyltransferase
MIRTTSEASEAEKTRVAAVTQHEHDAPRFERKYLDMRQDHRSSAFSYGRSKLDQLLGQVVARLPAGARILDVGCGTGEQIHAYREAGLDAAGIEPAHAMRERAQRLNPDATILDGTILSIPFPDRSFDFVLALEVLRYLDRSDWPQAFREMLRVLRPGAPLFVTLTNRYALDGFFLFHHLKRLASRVTPKVSPAHCEFVTPGEAVAMLTAAGARDVEVKGRMLASLRIPYKLGQRVGKAVARTFEGLDEKLAESRWHTPFAGHLIVMGRRPGDGGA